jgi:hypothetical protein
VATYVAPGPPRAARPPHVRLARRGSTLSISWGAAANATNGYEIIVISSDGRRLLFQRPSGRRTVTVPAFSSSGATVTVVGRGPDRRTGLPATAHLGKLGKPARVSGLSIKRRGSTSIRISWRSAARAFAYRIAITATGSTRTVLLVKTKRALSFTVKSSRVGVKVTVQGEGAMGVLGPAVTARLST